MTILAGGSGTRFWPLSTPHRPKQLLPLAGPNPLIRDTLERARGLAEMDRIRILTGSHLQPLFEAAIGELPRGSYLVEPQAKGTGPVLVWAARVLAEVDPDAVMISLHADHAIEPKEAFIRLLLEGAGIARQTGHLLTVAVPPTRPETGYGYIRPGEELPAGAGIRAFEVDAFVEKPDQETARRYVRDGYLWNSGIFLWRADAFLREVREVAPELAAHLPLLDQGDTEAFFRAVPNISVDEAVLERSGRVASLEATFRWDDVGAWEALGRTLPADGSGNVAVGDTHAVDSSENIIFAEKGSIVLYGVEDLVVVRSGETVLVARRDRTPGLKKLLEHLPLELRDPELS